MLQEENVSEEVVSSETTDEIVDSSSTGQQADESQTSTAEKDVAQGAEETTDVQEEEQRIPYSRFKEVNEEKKFLQKQLEAIISREQPQQPTQQPQDPYAGMDAETAHFYRGLDDRYKAMFNKELVEREKVYKEQLGVIQQQNISQMVKGFRADHPDVKPDSPDEHAIAEKITKFKMNTEDAYWAVMGPRGVANAQQRAMNTVKKSIQAKKQANVESSSGVSFDVQRKPEESIEDTFNKLYDAEIRK